MGSNRVGHDRSDLAAAAQARSSFQMIPFSSLQAAPAHSKQSGNELSPPSPKTAYLRANLVKNPPAMQETQVLPLGLEELLEKGMTIHFSVLAWRIPCAEEPGGL